MLYNHLFIQFSHFVCHWRGLSELSMNIWFHCICEVMYNNSDLDWWWCVMDDWAADPPHSRFARNLLQSANREDCWNPALTYPAYPIPSEWYHPQEVDFTIWRLPLLGNLCRGQFTKWNQKLFLHQFLCVLATKSTPICANFLAFFPFM